MTYNFSGQSFSNADDLAADIAAEFFGQHSNREILTAFNEKASFELAEEAIDGWDLAREEWMKNGDVTADMIGKALDNLRDKIITEVLVEIDDKDDIVQWCNCREVEFNGNGGVWVANPMTGHWLNDDERMSLAVWAVLQ